MTDDKRFDSHDGPSRMCPHRSGQLRDFFRALAYINITVRNHKWRRAMGALSLKWFVALGIAALAVVVAIGRSAGIVASASHNVPIGVADTSATATAATATQRCWSNGSRNWKNKCSSQRGASIAVSGYGGG